MFLNELPLENSKNNYTWRSFEIFQHFSTLSTTSKCRRSFKIYIVVGHKMENYHSTFFRDKKEAKIFFFREKLGGKDIVFFSIEKFWKGDLFSRYEIKRGPHPHLVQSHLPWRGVVRANLSVLVKIVTQNFSLNANVIFLYL